MTWHLVTLDFPPRATGGVASWVGDLAAALHHAGQPVIVHARSAPGDLEHDRGLPFPVRRLWGRSWNKHQALWVRLQLPRSLQPGDRVVFATWPLAARLGPRLQKGIWRALCLHGSEISARGVDLDLYRSVASSMDAVFAVSGHLAGLSVEAGVPAKVLPLPLPHTKTPGLGGDSLCVVARLTELKGVDRAIHLARALDRELVVVGEGRALGALQALAHRQKARVRFEGRLERERAGEVMGSSAATLLLSREDPQGYGAEGLGIVLVESQERGTPVIGAPTGGIPEAIGAGLLLADPDRPDLALVRAMLDDEGARTRARAWAQTHHGPDAALRTLMESP